jgi:hypothetical protein
MRQSISITFLVIVNSLFPAKGKGAPPGAVPGAVPPGSIPRYLADLGTPVGNDGKPALFLPGCMPLAAPFLLFRLKREGYSSCRATASRDGLLIEARR